MNTREAFRVFMKHQLEYAIEEGKIDLSKGDMMWFLQEIEDDPVFHNEMADFLAEFIENFGENYGLF